MADKIKLLGNRVLVKKISEEQKTYNGIIIPDNAKKDQEHMIVVSVGQGNKDKEGNLIEMPVKIGDTILAERYAAQELVIDNQEYYILRSENIIAVLF